MGCVDAGSIGRELIDLVLPVECAGCGRPGVRWCHDCAEQVIPEPPMVQPLGWVGGSTAAGFDVLVGAAYAGPLRSALIAYKDGGRWDLATVLAPVARQLIRAALTTMTEELDAAQRSAVLDDPARVLLIPIPSRASATRRRGERPVEFLVRRAWPEPPLRALAVGRVHDQSGLSAVERRRNISGAMRVIRRRAPLIRGAHCVLIDDIVTTGSTLLEGVRALGEAGAAQVVPVALAATATQPPRLVDS